MYIAVHVRPISVLIAYFTKGLLFNSNVLSWESTHCLVAFFRRRDFGNEGCCCCCCCCSFSGQCKNKSWRKGQRAGTLRRLRSGFERTYSSFWAGIRIFNNIVIIVKYPLPDLGPHGNNNSRIQRFAYDFNENSVVVIFTQRYYTSKQKHMMILREFWGFKYFSLTKQPEKSRSVYKTDLDF